MAPVSQRCIWTAGLTETIMCPIAHGEGRFLTDAETLADLVAADQVALRYVRPDGSSAGGEFPFNPNGSIADIAGITDATGLVLGLMPHPEDHIDGDQHPRSHRGGSLGQSGLALFANGVRHAVGT
jgi:phosphoribosylformylglycinamidine synthase